MPKQAASDRIVCPLFSDIHPPLYADEIGEIRVYKVLGSKDFRGSLVVFAKKRYIDANEGEVFVIDPATTTEADLVTVLEADPPGSQYSVMGFDAKSGGKIERAHKFLRLEESDEDEDDDEIDLPPPPNSGDKAYDLLSTILVQQMKSKDEPVKLAVEMANAMTQKEAPGAVASELQKQLDAVRAKAEDDIRLARRKAEDEIDEARSRYKKEIDAKDDQLRELRARSDRREDEHRAELREMRTQTQNQIYQLQQQNLDLQQKSGQELLKTQSVLMQAQMDKQMAERDASDAESALEAVNQSKGQSAAEDAAAAAIPGWMKPLVPFFPLVVQYMKAQGMKVPKELEQQINGQPQEAPPAPQQQPPPQQPPQQVRRVAPVQSVPVQQQPAPVVTPPPNVPVMPVGIRREAEPIVPESEEFDDDEENDENPETEEAS